MEVRKIPKKTVTVIHPARSNIVDKSRHQQLRVAAYCRVSTDNEEQLTSYENQKKVYTEMIASRTDWTLAGIYADEGISGTQVKKRKNFKKMIDQCLAGKIDYIVTKSVSRFARNTVECLEYVRMLKARGIGIFFEEQNIDTLNSDSELYLVIYAGFAQSESESISKNITWSIRKKYEEGIPTFSYRNWLGYRKGADGEPEIIPEEAAVVRRIFELYLSGNPQQVISDMNLMRVTLADALGLNESTEETASLQSMIDGLNRKMIEIVNESVQTGTDIACYEDQLRGISEKIESLKQQIEIIRQKTVPTQDQDCRVARMQQIIESREENTEVYDDSTVRQMVECIKVYHDGRLEIIFGCGITIEERVMITNIKNKQTKGKTA